MIAVHAFFVRGFDDFCATLDGWLLESRPRPQLPQHTRLFKFLFETFQGLVDRLVVFYVNDKHVLNILF